MLNKIWFALLAFGLLYGFGRPFVVSLVEKEETAPTTAAAQASENAAAEPPPPTDTSTTAAMSEMGKRLTNAAIDSAETSVKICIGLIGMMALWLGMMKIAEDAGLVTLIAKLLRPLLRWLFPDIPRDHPAGGAIIMNMAANMLGLDNAATPLGLKAMKELQSLNPTKDTATNSMAMFLAINTSSISLIAFTIIAYRKTSGSENPASVITAMLLATTCSTIVAIIASRVLQRYYRVPPASPSTSAPAAAAVEQDGEAC